MSNFYLCHLCRRERGRPDRARCCWYKYCDCEVRGDVRMPVMHDGVELPTDLCEIYEPKEGACR